MDFAARMRKRQQESSSCVTPTCHSKGIENSGKKAKRDFGSQSSQSVEYDEVDLIASEPPSPVLLDMETDVVNKSSTPSRNSSNASIENATGKKWIIPKDVKNYRHTRHTIDPFVEDQDSSEKPLTDKRANRSDPVGYVPLYPRKGCTATTEDKNRLVNEFAKVLDLVHRCQRRSLTYREWRKPFNASSGSLNRKKDAADDQPTSFAGRINNRLRTETVTNNSDEENEENALIPYLPPADDAEVPGSQGDDNAHNRTFVEEPQSRSDFTLQIESNSDEDFIPVSKKLKNRKGKNRNKGADKQQPPNRQARDRGSNVANDDKKRMEVSQRFLRSRPPSDYSVHTPSAGRKLMSRFQEPESDDLVIDDNFVLKSNNIGFRKHNPRTYSMVAAAGSSKGEVDEERRPATRNRLALARQPIRRIDVGGIENERDASPNRRRGSPEIRPQSQDNDDDDKVQCPLCRRMFRANVIEEHASDCLGEAEDDSTRCEADKQKCYLCCENISLPLYSTHVKQCIETRLAKSDSQTIGDDVEMKQVENSSNHIVPPTEMHILDEVAAVPVVNQENLIRNGSSAAADLATFVPIRQLSVKLFDFNQQFASSRPTNATNKRKVAGGKKRKWKKKNRWRKKKK